MGMDGGRAGGAPPTGTMEIIDTNCGPHFPVPRWAVDERVPSRPCCHVPAGAELGGGASGGAAELEVAPCPACPACPACLSTAPWELGSGSSAAAGSFPGPRGS